MFLARATPLQGDEHPLQTGIGDCQHPSAASSILSLVLKCWLQRARDHGSPTCARQAKGRPLHSSRPSGASRTAPPRRARRTAYLADGALSGEALGWSARPTEGNGRAHTSTGGGRPPVTVGPARRLCKGRDWSFEIHRTGALKTAAEKAPGRLGES